MVKKKYTSTKNRRIAIISNLYNNELLCKAIGLLSRVALKSCYILNSGLFMMAPLFTETIELRYNSFYRAKRKSRPIACITIRLLYKLLIIAIRLFFRYLVYFF